jgi:hypothetical protein
VIVCFKLQTKFLIEHPQVTVGPARDRLRNHLLHFLSQDAHVNLAAAVVAEAIEAQAVVESDQEDNVVLQPDVGTPSASATTTTAEAAARAHSTPAATVRCVRGATAAHTRGASTAAPMCNVLAATAAHTSAAGAMRDVLTTTAADTLTGIAGAAMCDMLATVRGTMTLAKTSATAAGIDNPLATAATKIQPLFTAAAIAKALLGMSPAVPVIRNVIAAARSAYRDVVFAPIDVAAPITA